MHTDKNLALSIYKDALRNNAATHSSGIITNKDKDYAVAFYAELFANTTSSVRIFCQGAHSAVWRDPEFEKAFLKMATTPDISIQILTEENHENISNLPLFLRNLLNDNTIDISLHHLNREGREVISNRFSEDINFAFFDDEKYRFETDTVNFKAFGSFNDRETVGQLRNVFHEAFDKSDITEVSDDTSISSTPFRSYQQDTHEYIVSEPVSYPVYPQTMQSSGAS